MIIAIVYMLYDTLISVSYKMSIMAIMQYDTDITVIFGLMLLCLYCMTRTTSMLLILAAGSISKSDSFPC